MGQKTCGCSKGTDNNQAIKDKGVRRRKGSKKGSDIEVIDPTDEIIPTDMTDEN